MNDETAFYLNKARNGHRGVAFHGLIELRDDLLNDLEGAYRVESDSAIRSLIVEAVWQHRLPSCLEFLAVALEDPAPEVRKQALDGLVALASPESKRILESAKSRMVGHDADFRDWIEEAIGQIDEATTPGL